VQPPRQNAQARPFEHLAWTRLAREPSSHFAELLSSLRATSCSRAEQACCELELLLRFFRTRWNHEPGLARRRPPGAFFAAVCPRHPAPIGFLSHSSQSCHVQFLAGSGRTFNVEERASIQSSLHMLKAEQVLGPLLGLAHIACGAVRCGLQGFARVQLWGKLFGQKTDYIIAQGIYQVCILQAGLRSVPYRAPAAGKPARPPSEWGEAFVEGW